MPSQTTTEARASFHLPCASWRQYLQAMMGHHSTTCSMPRGLPLLKISLASALQNDTEMQSPHDDFGDSPRDYVLYQLGGSTGELPCSVPTLSHAGNTNDVAEPVTPRVWGSKKEPKQQHGVHLPDLHGPRPTPAAFQQGAGSTKQDGHFEVSRDSSIVITARASAATVDNGKACTGARRHARSAPSMDALQLWPSKATTVMLRNIPNRYTAEEILAEMLSVGFDAPKFDFLYLPIDFMTKRNRGYCFINFRKAADAFRFVQAFHGQRLTRYATRKILEVSPAVTQGFEKNVAQYASKHADRIQNPWFRPMIFRAGDDMALASTAAK